MGAIWPGGANVPASQPLFVVIRPGARTRSIQRWLRRLVPAALLVVSMAAPPAPGVIVLDDQDGEAGPLSLADALMRQRGPGSGATADVGVGGG